MFLEIFNFTLIKKKKHVYRLMWILLKIKKDLLRKTLSDNGKTILLTDIRTKNKFKPFVSQHKEK